MTDNKIRLYTQATVDLEFQGLPGDGTLNDRMFKYLVTIGGEGTLTDMLKQWHDGAITATLTDTFDFGNATLTGTDTFDFGNATGTGTDTFDFGDATT